MLVGNSRTCEACVKQDVCKYVSDRTALLDTLETSIGEVNTTETPFTVSVSCDSFSSGSVADKRRGVI